MHSVQTKVLAVLLAVLVALGVVLTVLNGNVTENSRNLKLGRAQRQEYQAETRWLECQPETPVTVTDPVRLKLCEGYTTVAESLESERRRSTGR